MPGKHPPITAPGTDRTFSRARIMVVMLIPLAMSLIAVSSINVALPTISVGLGASSSDLQWVLSGYALTFGIALIPSGRIGDAMGRGSLFVVGLVVFSAACLTAGLAPSALILNLARLVQGVGAGMFSPQTSGMIQHYFKGVERAKAFALFGMVVSVSVAVGPVLAGFVISLFGPAEGWRYTFLFNVPLGLLGIAAAAVWLPFSEERQRRIEKLERRAAVQAGDTSAVAPSTIDLDPIGAILIALAVLSIMLPFMSHDNPWMWGLVVIGIGLLVVWYRWERRYAAKEREPLVNLGLFTYQSFSLGTAASGIQFLGATSVFVIVALYLQNGLGASALTTGLITLPNAAASMVAAGWAGKRVVSQGRKIPVEALSLVITGVVSAAVLVWVIGTLGVSQWWLMVPLAVMGFGQGAMGASNQTLSMHDVPAIYGGTAGALKQTVERIGTAIGTAMITAVFFATASSAGWESGFAAAFAVITVILLCALAVARIDERIHRDAPAIS